VSALEDATLTETEMKVALLRKWHAATKDIEAIEKGSENTFHHYRYAGIEEIVNGTREHLLQHGLLVLAGLAKTSERGRQTSQGESTVTTVELVFSIFDIETGFSFELHWAGRGDDPADKGVSKALTDARKTFLIQQLNIARGDDTEGDPSTDERSYGNAGNASEMVNMVADAKGLSDASLNRVLVAAGLPAAQKPFGAFTRIPREVEALVREELQKARA
jgi:hypothetical protein